MIADLKSVLGKLGFVHKGTPRLSQFSHPAIEWFVEFPPMPVSFGHLHVRREDCAIMETTAGELRIITPTQSVVDRLAAAVAWNDAQSREQAVLVATHQEIDWDKLKQWFVDEGETVEAFEPFRAAVTAIRRPYFSGRGG